MLRSLVGLCIKQTSTINADAETLGKECQSQGSWTTQDVIAVLRSAPFLNIPNFGLYLFIKSVEERVADPVAHVCLPFPLLQR